MSEYLYTEAEVRRMWLRSYEEQIGIAQAKALEAIVRTDGKVVVSLSGGKDSAMMLYIVSQMWACSRHRNDKLIVMFADTSNEFNCMRKYVRELCSYIENAFEIEIDLKIVRGNKHYFDVVEEVGFPFISKKVARCVRDVKATLKRLNLTYADIEHLLPETYTRKHFGECLQAANRLREGI